jgi:hypothetical protein
VPSSAVVMPVVAVLTVVPVLLARIVLAVVVLPWLSSAALRPL